MYDSRPDTEDHITEVQNNLSRVIENLYKRGRDHDQSKLLPPEKEAFDEATPRLRGTTYGSPEYKEGTDRLGVALEHHYAVNDHHPEHHTIGITGMSLMSLIEMLCDWRAATMRHADGDLARSFEINRERFGIDPMLYEVLLNTARELGWVE